MVPTKDVSFHEYKDSKDLFNGIKNFQIKFSEVKNQQNKFLDKINNIKIGKKTTEQKETNNNIKNFTTLEKKLIIFLETILKYYLLLITIQNKMKIRGKDLKF